jgi:MFS family permease
MVYPTLLAAIGDVAHPTWRASSIGVYRLWRDGGFAIGALFAGAIADWLGLAAAIWAVAALTARCPAPSSPFACTRHTESRRNRSSQRPHVSPTPRNF